MQEFTIHQPSTLRDAAAAAASRGTRYIAGGTDLLQLMKDNVEQPTRLVDLEQFGSAEIDAGGKTLRLGAMARMSDVAAHDAVRDGWPVISQALLASASPQIRNMGTIGGNLLQRTRCGYFRDIGFACNKRKLGSGCPAIGGENRLMAILGGSEHCIATHASDLAVALTALDATLHLLGSDGAHREVSIGAFYRLPGNTPHIENTLLPGEMIASVTVPHGQLASNSHYLKLRDRASFEFALVSIAVAAEIDGGTIRDIRLAAGGVGTRPWRLSEVETALRGKHPTEAVIREAAARAGDGARPSPRNRFKQTLLRAAVLRGLQTLAA